MTLAKKLYGRYMELPPEMFVPYALANGGISFKDIPRRRESTRSIAWS